MSSFRVYVILGLIGLAGLAFAAVLLNIPIWFVALGLAVVLGVGFLFLTRRAAAGRAAAAGRTHDTAGPGRR